MIAKLRPRLSYANVIATLALFLALGGGAYAAINLPKNSVGSKQLKDRAVTPAKVSPATVKRFRGQTGLRGHDGQRGSDAASAFTGVVAETPNGPTVVYCPAQGQIVTTTAGSAPGFCSTQDHQFSQGSPNASMTGRDLFVRQDTAPGVGASRTYTLHANGLDTPVSCTIAGTATTCNSGVATTVIPPGSRLALKIDGGLANSADAGRTTFGWRATTP
jgi:hypothetical protein